MIHSTQTKTTTRLFYCIHIGEHRMTHKVQCLHLWNSIFCSLKWHSYGFKMQLVCTPPYTIAITKKVYYPSCLLLLTTVQGILKTCRKMDDFGPMGNVSNGNKHYPLALLTSLRSLFLLMRQD